MVLDLGCGNVKIPQKVSERTGASVVGCDFSHPLLISWGGRSLCGWNQAPIQERHF